MFLFDSNGGCRADNFYSVFVLLSQIRYPNQIRPVVIHLTITSTRMHIQDICYGDEWMIQGKWMERKTRKRMPTQRDLQERSNDVIDSRRSYIWWWRWTTPQREEERERALVGNPFHAGTVCPMARYMHRSATSMIQCTFGAGKRPQDVCNCARLCLYEFYSLQSVQCAVVRSCSTKKHIHYDAVYPATPRGVRLGTTTGVP